MLAVKSGGPHGGEWQLLLERTDDARRGSREALLWRDARLDLRGDGPGRGRDLLGRQGRRGVGRGHLSTGTRRQGNRRRLVRLYRGDRSVDRAGAPHERGGKIAPGAV